MRADMWRYAVLYVHGGLYVDADVQYSRRVHDWLQKPACRASHQSLSRQDFMYAARPRHPIFRAALDLIVRRVIADGGVLPSRRAIHFVHHYTGPGMFTTAVLQTLYPQLYRAATTPVRCMHRSHRTGTWTLFQAQMQRIGHCGGCAKKMLPDGAQQPLDTAHTRCQVIAVNLLERP